VPGLIVYIDSSKIHEGKEQELEAAMSRLAEFVKANEPQLLSYAIYLNEGATRMTVIAVHPDSASMEFHMRVAGAEFRKLRDLITLTRIEVYGEVSERALEQLHQKAQMLGGGSVTVSHPSAGFARFGAR